MNRLLVIPLVVAACHSDHDNPDARIVGDVLPDAADGRVDVADIPVTINRDVDLLFVIDDSPSMIDKQVNLRNNFPAFINALQSLPDGLPNLHLGVVTSDLGTSATLDPTPGPTIGSGPGACSGQGKAGVLQTFGAPVTGNFLSDVANSDGTRTINYTGTLADTFSMMATAGANGCGFEQHLEAARRALDGSNAANAGFLRPTASLGIIVLADEDDCSASHTALFGTDTTTLGPLQSFRCTHFGVTCDQGGSTPDEMNQVGQKVSCHSNDASPYITDLPGFATFFKGLKANPSSVMVSAIIGPPTPFAVELDVPPGGGTAVPTLAHSCQYVDTQGASEVADPAVRLAQLAGELGHGVVSTICQQDLSAAEAMIAQQVRSLVGDSCLTRDIAMPPDCVAVATSSTGQMPLPACPSGGNCFSIAPDAVACPLGQHEKVTLTWAIAPPTDTVVSVRCKP